MVHGANVQTGLIELLHLNAGQHGGAVISFPANVIVSVPGRGRMELGETLAVGGPSLMIRTLEHLTDVRIDHYSAIDFAGLTECRARNGRCRRRCALHHHEFRFDLPPGINHLAGGIAECSDALAYVRQPAVSEVGRMELQENLFRAILHKIAKRSLLAWQANWRVLNAVVHAVSVDSDFSNAAGAPGAAPG